MSGDEMVVRFPEAIVVHPGETLVVTVPDSVNQKQLDEVADRIRPKLPERTQLIVLGGVLQIYVLRAGEVAE